MSVPHSCAVQHNAECYSLRLLQCALSSIVTCSSVIQQTGLWLTFLRQLAMRYLLVCSP